MIAAISLEDFVARIQFIERQFERGEFEQTAQALIELAEDLLRRQAFDAGDA